MALQKFLVDGDQKSYFARRYSDFYLASELKYFFKFENV